MKPDISAIQQTLSPLVGLPLRCFGRAANMLMLDLGEVREVVARRGGTASVSDWSIHIQCVWRLCRQARIVVGYRDFYYSPEGEPLDDWDEPGKSRFDHTAGELNAEFAVSPPCILSLKIDDVGGFSLLLGHDYRLDVFPDRRSGDEDSEYWRLLGPGSDDEHFVVS